MLESLKIEYKNGAQTILNADCNDPDTIFNRCVENVNWDSVQNAYIFAYPFLGEPFVLVENGNIIQKNLKEFLQTMDE